jgi:hypothetical protein
MTALEERRVCRICDGEVPPGQGVHFAWLGVLLHEGQCYNVLKACLRIYDRSTRGRWRQGKRKILRMARERFAAAKRLPRDVNDSDQR